MLELQIYPPSSLSVLTFFFLVVDTSTDIISFSDIPVAWQGRMKSVIRNAARSLLRYSIDHTPKSALVQQATGLKSAFANS